jgi:hypothetical protein
MVSPYKPDLIHQRDFDSRQVNKHTHLPKVLYTCIEKIYSRLFIFMIAYIFVCIVEMKK